MAERKTIHQGDPVQTPKNWKLETGDDGVVMLYLNSGPAVNVMTEEVLRELGGLFTDFYAAYRGGTLKAVVIASAKENAFCAGADIPMIAGHLEDPDGAKPFLRAGKEIFLLVCDAPFPVVAAISGDCLGGGLELALVCDARVVSADPKTALGLPETQLGLIPGLGGTQTLPRVVGLKQSLDMILSGKRLNAREAYEAGLADHIVLQPLLLTEARKLALRLVASGTSISRKPPVRERIPFVRRIILAKAKEAVVAKTRGVYPAPLIALRAIAASGPDLRAGWEKEHDLFVEALKTPEAKSLISIFLVSQEAKAGAWLNAKAQLPKKAGVIGAGAMGRGIAHALITSGIPAVLYDLDPKQVVSAASEIRGLLEKAVKRGKMSGSEAQKKLALLVLSSAEDFSAFRDADLVVEAVVENVAVKHKVYAALQTQLPADAIIATNTSSIPLGELVPAINDPSRFCAMHFFNPVHKMQLVEISGHEGTSPETLAAAVLLSKKFRKTPVVLKKDCPGFIINRVLFYYLGMSLDAVLKGAVSPVQLDRAFKKMGMVMGPFEELDLVGFDVAANVLRTLDSHYSDWEFDFSVFANYVKSGAALGLKSGKGVYLYENGRKKGENPEFSAAIAPKGAAPDGKVAERAAAAIYARMVKEARAMADEGISEPRFIDLACILGAGITPNRRGLLGTD